MAFREKGHHQDTLESRRTAESERYLAGRSWRDTPKRSEKRWEVLQRDMPIEKKQNAQKEKNLSPFPEWWITLEGEYR